LTKDQETLASLLLLAEMVAKVTYNATDPPDEFDENSGWWIAARELKPRRIGSTSFLPERRATHLKMLGRGLDAGDGVMP
jgi:hypothetical protein